MKVDVFPYFPLKRGVNIQFLLRQYEVSAQDLPVANLLRLTAEVR